VRTFLYSALNLSSSNLRIQIRIPNPTIVSSPALGPLLTATIALFGPLTFFSTQANSTPTLPNIASESLDQCSDPVPFSYVTHSYTSDNNPWPWRYKGLGTCASHSQSAYLMTWWRGSVSFLPTMTIRGQCQCSPKEHFTRTRQTSSKPLLSNLTIGPY
jgi:hypothetical protein